MEAAGRLGSLEDEKTEASGTLKKDYVITEYFWKSSIWSRQVQENQQGIPLEASRLA